MSNWFDLWRESEREEESPQAVDEVQKIKEDLEELQATFNLIWKAQQRAIQMWQQKTGQGLNWPDKASLIVWLMEENESLREQCQSALQRAQVAESYHEETKKEAVHEKDMRIRLVKEYGDKAAHWKAEWLKEAKRCQELERKLNDN